MQTRGAISDMLNTILDNKEAITSRYHSMSYADGLEEALSWVLGNVTEKLIDVEDLK